MSLIKGYDPRTLREVVDVDECLARLEEIEGLRDLNSLLERVWLLKVTGQLEEGREVAELAVRTARMAGTRRELLRARMLHACILQFQGELVAAERELDRCASEAEGLGWSRMAAFAHQHRGKVLLEQGEFAEARAALKTALFLRREGGAPEDELESTLIAIDAIDRLRGDITAPQA